MNFFGPKTGCSTKLVILGGSRFQPTLGFFLWICMITKSTITNYEKNKSVRLVTPMVKPFFRQSPKKPCTPYIFQLWFIISRDPIPLLLIVQENANLFIIAKIDWISSNFWRKWLPKNWCQFFLFCSYGILLIVSYMIGTRNVIKIVLINWKSATYYGSSGQNCPKKIIIKKKFAKLAS
jgi:hypothetical protein